MTTQLSADRFDAVLFELDGVLTGTAAVHARAWQTMLDDVLRTWSRRRAGGEPAA
jgi:beta-phosphoglucomutase-like phosphatase (HAD superfamily)